MAASVSCLEPLIDTGGREVIATVLAQEVRGKPWSLRVVVPVGHVPKHANGLARMWWTD